MELSKPGSSQSALAEVAQGKETYGKRCAIARVSKVSKMPSLKSW